jgi:uncharacterized protein YbjT (DUF2867 family)
MSEAGPGQRCVLVTGGTGRVGSLVAATLAATGKASPRVLSRRTPKAGEAVHGEWVTANLVRDELGTALHGVDVVVHLASEKGRGDADVIATRRLLEAARAANVRHLVAISIIGCDRIPLPFYASKLAIEAQVRAAGIPWTIVRVAQFHSFVERLVAAAASLPIPAPIFADLRFQPVDEGEVAQRFVELSLGAPEGDAPDFAGPQLLSLGEIAATWLAAKRGPAMLVPVSAAVATAGAAVAPQPEPWVAGVLDGYRQAWNTPSAASTKGRVTFAEWLLRRGHGG